MMRLRNKGVHSMDSNIITVDLYDGHRVWIDPCDCCDHSMLVIETPSCLTRIHGLEPSDLMRLCVKLAEVAEMQASKEDDEFDPEWN